MFTVLYRPTDDKLQRGVNYAKVLLKTLGRLVLFFTVLYKLWRNRCVNLNGDNHYIQT